LELPAIERPGSDSAGLSPIRCRGAREKYTREGGEVHRACTVFPQEEKIAESQKKIKLRGKTKDYFLFDAKQGDNSVKQPV
jgi:hypothetical protein